MRDTKSLVQIDMTDISAISTRAAKADLSIEIGAI